MSEASLNKFWHQRIVAPIVAQLTQGVTPKHLALSCAIGFSLGIFPILGSTTLLCFLAGLLFKLNQPVLQVVNYLVYPVQIIMVPVFVRLGETLFHAEHVSFSPLKLGKELTENPNTFFAKYGLAGAHGMTAWALLSPLAFGLIYFACHPLFERINERMKKKRGEQKDF